jgi:hypothetical protein
LASLHQRRWVQFIQWDVPSVVDVDFPIFNGSAHVNELNVVAVPAEFREGFWRDAWNGHGLLLGNSCPLKTKTPTHANPDPQVIRPCLHWQLTTAF